MDQNRVLALKMNQNLYRRPMNRNDFWCNDLGPTLTKLSF